MSITIAGIDISMNGTGMTILKLDDDLNIIESSYRGFTTTAAQYKKDTENQFLLNKKNYQHELLQFIAVADQITKWCVDAGVEYAAIEGYSFGSIGKTFNMAENCGLIKTSLLKAGIKLRIYDPNSIKKIATGDGSAKKENMLEAFNEIPVNEKVDITKLGSPTTHPSEDIIDAFFMAKLLRLELSLRKGLVTLRDLNEDQISVFNRVTKAFPVNILDTPFIGEK